LSAAGLADTYLLVKALHIVSATILFGTGLGTAFFFWSSRHAGNEARLFAARTTVRADFLFTLPAVIVQPLTGVWMMERAGFRVDEPWIAISVALYILAGVCWLPVVGLQIRMKRMLEVQANGGEFDAAAFEHYRRTWFALGWPAFLGLVVVFFLMVVKPSW
jgi:uncharacterized membrane protein